MDKIQVDLDPIWISSTSRTCVNAAQFLFISIISISGENYLDMGLYMFNINISFTKLTKFNKV